MSTDDIRTHAIQAASPGDELAWWRSTIEVERRIRAFRLSRHAAVAALSARNAVLAAASRGAQDRLDGDMVACVSRVAAEAARALVAGGCLVDGISLSVDCDTAASGAAAGLNHPTAA
jgi:hypothetical protein